MNKKDINYWEGFDSAIELVINSLNNQDENVLFSVHKFINEFKDELEHEVELYKKDG